MAEISVALRARLDENVPSLPALDTRGAETLNRFLMRLSACERQLLPRKKQRALDEMEHIVDKLIAYSNQQEHQIALDHILRIKEMLRNPPPNNQPDWDEVAARWLDVIRPIWFDKLRTKNRKPLLLKDVRKDLLKDKTWLIEQVVAKFRSFPVLAGPETRICACIIGVA